MKLRNRSVWIDKMIAFALLFILVGCGLSLSETQQPFTTPSPGITPTAILPPTRVPTSTSTSLPTTLSSTTDTPEVPTLTRTPWPTPTFIPTILPGQQDNLVQLLKTNECKLPCYMGITPGITTWEDASAILESAGATLSYESEKILENKSSVLVRGFNLWIGDPSIQFNERRELTRTYGIYSAGIVHSIEVITDQSNKVQRIYVSAGTSRFITKFLDYWSRYTLIEILQRHGSPDEIYLSYGGTGYGQVLVYARLGAVIETNGKKDGDMYCPVVPETFPSVILNLTLTSPGSPLGLYRLGIVPPTDREVYLPVEEMLGISTSEFRAAILADPTTCFRALKMLPQ